MLLRRGAAAALRRCAPARPPPSSARAPACALASPSRSSVFFLPGAFRDGTLLRLSSSSSSSSSAASRFSSAGGRGSHNDDDDDNEEDAEDAAGGAGVHRRGRPRPTALPAADRQIELARTVKRKLEACGADALAALTLTDWDAFFADTGLAEDTRAPEDAALLTLMLSYPLTLAWLVQEQKRAADVAAVAAQSPSSPSVSPSASPPSPPSPPSSVRKIQIIGARAEVSLPPWVWHLVANLTGVNDLDVCLVGPMVPRTRPRVYDNVTVSLAGQVLYHVGVSNGMVDTAGVDAFFCFHPGWGQREWQNSWRPTLDLLFAGGAPVYFTSFDDNDVRADCAFARQQLRQLVKVGDGNTIVLKKHKKSLWSGENPFRSKVFIQLEPGADDESPDENKRLIAVNRMVSMIVSSSSSSSNLGGVAEEVAGGEV